MTADASAPERESVFLKIADYVSAAMGRPTNIIIWLVAVVAWTGTFALGGSHIASGTWLPAWFTSQGFNFPLNLVTTVAELFIGFLVPADAVPQLLGLIMSLFAFVGGLFIPISLLPQTIQDIAKWSPEYGLNQLVHAPLLGVGVHLAWVGNALAWLAIFVAGTIWRFRKDTGRV